MATKITNSVVTSTTTPSSDFTVTGNFEIIVKLGRVMLETKVDGVYYKVTDVNTRYAQSIILPEGTSTRLNSIEAGRTYRIVPVGVATAEAWQL